MLFLETGVNDVSCISDILHFMGYRPLATEIDARRIGFFAKATVNEYAFSVRCIWFWRTII